MIFFSVITFVAEGAIAKCQNTEKFVKWTYMVFYLNYGPNIKECFDHFWKTSWNFDICIQSLLLVADGGSKLYAKYLPQKSLDYSFKIHFICTIFWIMCQKLQNHKIWLFGFLGGRIDLINVLYSTQKLENLI